MEIEIQPRRFYRQDCLLVAIRNVSGAVKAQGMEIKSRTQTQLRTLMQQELLNTLSSIVSISTILLDAYQNKTAMSLKQQVSSIKVVWGSAKQL